MKNLIRQFTSNAPISLQLIGAVIIFFLVTAFAQIYLANAYIGKSVLSETHIELEAAAEFNAHELQYRIDRLKRDVLFMSQTPAIQAIVRGTSSKNHDSPEKQNLDFWKKHLGNLFTAFIKANPEYFQVRLIGIEDEGREIVRAQFFGKEIGLTPTEKLQQKKSRDYFAATTKLNQGDVYLSNINLNQEFGVIEVPHKRTLRAATPVYSEEGIVFGIVIINMDVGETLDKLSRAASPNLLTYLVNQNGDFLVHPNSTLTFGYELGHPYKWRDEFKPTNNLNTQDTNEKNLQTLINGNGLVYVSQKELQLDASRTLTLSNALSDDSVQAKKNQVLKIVVGSTLVLCLLITFLLFYLIKIILRPLNQLSEASYAIGDGRYDVKLPTFSSQEFNSLTQAYNLMLSRIASRDQEISESNLRLKASVDYANLVIDSMLEAIVIVDSSGKITRTNIQVKELFGYEPDELIGQLVEVLLPTEFQFNHAAHRQSFFRSTSTRAMGQGRDLYARRKDGTLFPVEIGLNPIQKDQNMSVLAAIVDITERKQAEQKQLQLLKKLSEINAELNSFTHIASHDLKSPLRGIDQLATWITEDLGDTLNPETQEHLRLMRTRIARMEMLLDDLLAYSRVGRTDDDIVEVNTQDLLNNVVDLMATNKEITFNIANNLPTFKTSKVPLEMVFRNLISNAIKHHDKAQGIITILFQKKDEWFEFTVQDDGPGIPLDQQKRVFEMFQTLKTRDTVEGSGIGLALVKKAVEMMGGSVRLISDGQSGCSFIFTWPITRN